ncbi:hypothetical protein F5Y03DRAFT_333129 [Xylaria venustula]|nr:hypothetical protein F5Y03DRAFT_333129 [Xylaria venustula]
MSGLEFLGALASTAQLVAYVITVSSKLSEVRCQMRHAPKKLEQYDRQLKQLIAITRHMEQKPPIQTEDLQGCLATILARTRAIKDVLDKFEQSSKRRRRWVIINGDLSRQLDECFEDVRNTMENIVVLIVSQNAHGQRELKELMVGIAATTIQTTTTSTPSSCPTDSTVIRPPSTCAANSTVTTSEGGRRKAGSHLFRGITMKDNVNVSMGNISSPCGTITVPSMAGHTFTDFAGSGNKFLHIGNTGYSSEGHTFEDGVIEKNEATVLGDFANLEQKFQHISLQRSFT